MDTDAAFSSILACMMKLEFDAIYSYVNVRVDSKFKTDCLDIRWMCQDYLCNLAEIWAELSGRMRHPLEICNQEFNSTPIIEIDEYKPLIRSDLSQLACVIELYYPNFNHDVQRILDDILRRCNHLANYSI